MGCGESKHAVATGNTITRKKSEAGSSRKSKDIKTVNETTQKEEIQNVKKCLGAVAEVKDITDEDKESKEEAQEMNKEHGFAFEDQEPGRLISKESPNRFFSSRKDEDIEGFAFEGSLYMYTGETAIVKEEHVGKEEKLAVPPSKDLKET
ncbi:hypothetical protein GH714_002319 [Hevea brasiliensis]|uniref:Uncharacterized protein n=1 Tax=Hevea brasiliensis TaxID=3981 RepID=A0A6A6KHP2_HEVBR|nr:hypothetical protein GH714_002319 [Hevea brasiliensis]